MKEKSKTMKSKKFKVSIKQNNDFAYLINIDNADEFYIYENNSRLTDGKIYKESDIVIEGRFVKSIKNIR